MRFGGVQGGGVAVELGQVFGGQVDAAVGVVLADVAQDVGQLEGDAERVGQFGGVRPVVARVRQAEDPWSRRFLIGAVASLVLAIVLFMVYKLVLDAGASGVATGA